MFLQVLGWWFSPNGIGTSHTLCEARVMWRKCWVDNLLKSRWRLSSHTVDIYRFLVVQWDVCTCPWNCYNINYLLCWHRSDYMLQSCFIHLACGSQNPNYRNSSHNLRIWKFIWIFTNWCFALIEQDAIYYIDIYPF